MNWLGKLFKKKKKGYNTDGKYKLLIINEDADHLHENLGISEARAEEITTLCLHAYRNNEVLHACLEEVVNHCKHTNEVVFATLIAHRVIENLHTKDKVNSLLKNLFGRG